MYIRSFYRMGRIHPPYLLARGAPFGRVLPSSKGAYKPTKKIPHRWGGGRGLCDGAGNGTAAHCFQFLDKFFHGVDVVGVEGVCIFVCEHGEFVFTQVGGAPCNLMDVVAGAGDYVGFHAGDIHDGVHDIVGHGKGIVAGVGLDGDVDAVVVFGEVLGFMGVDDHVPDFFVCICFCFCVHC